MLKTNSNKYKRNFDDYMAGVFESEDYIKDYTTLKMEFERVANYPYNLQKFPNTQDRLSDYLQGLPLNIEYTNFNILVLDKKLREYTDNLTDKQVNHLLENYWHFMAFQIKNRW